MTNEDNSIRTGDFASFPTRVCNAIENPNQKLIFIMLSHLSNINHEVYPSIDYICEMTGLNRKTAMKHLNELEKNDFIKKKKRFNNSTVYMVRFRLNNHCSSQ